MLRGYDVAAADLIPAYDAIDPAQLYAAVLDLFPAAPATVVDVGAGTGRDAAWLAERGYRVVAVEPVAALRERAAGCHADASIRWVDDRLPDLDTLTDEAGRVDLVLVSGVWQHLMANERERALVTLARLVAPGGLLVLSLRHGPGAVGRSVVPIDPDATIRDAAAAGLLPIRRIERSSSGALNRAAGVTWTWLAFRRG